VVADPGPGGRRCVMKPDARVWRKTRRDAIRGIKRGRRPRRVLIEAPRRSSSWLRRHPGEIEYWLTHAGAGRLRADRRMAAERDRDAEQAQVARTVRYANELRSDGDEVAAAAALIAAGVDTAGMDTAPGQTKRTAELAAAMRVLAEHAVCVAGELESRIAAGEGAAA
jgi:hypothetical protein